MTPDLHLFRILLAVALSTLGGCSVFGDRSVRYLGNTNEVAELECPPGFVVSPGKAVELINSRRPYPHVFADEYYHDDENYYVITCANVHSKNSRVAKGGGTIINGQTGEVFNRETQAWEAVPERQFRSRSDDVTTSLNDRQ